MTSQPAISVCVLRVDVTIVEKGVCAFVHIPACIPVPITWIAFTTKATSRVRNVYARRVTVTIVERWIFACVDV